MISILLVDDHPLYREGLRTALTNVPGMVVVGEAANGLEAVALADSLRPDVIVMDVHLPDISGIEATARICALNAEAVVVVVTMLDDDASLFASVEAGARGYLLKGADRAEIVRTISAVNEGEVVFGPGVAARVLASLRPLRSRSTAFPSLTERELAVLELLADGHTNRDIAARLHLGYKTVRNYVSAIFTKLDVGDREAAGELARSAGLGSTR